MACPWRRWATPWSRSRWGRKGACRLVPAGNVPSPKGNVPTSRDNVPTAWGMFHSRVGTFPKPDECSTQRDGTFPKLLEHYPVGLEHSPAGWNISPRSGTFSQAKGSLSPVWQRLPGKGGLPPLSQSIAQGGRNIPRRYGRLPRIDRRSALQGLPRSASRARKRTSSASAASALLLGHGLSDHLPQEGELIGVPRSFQGLSVVVDELKGQRREGRVDGLAQGMPE